MLPLLPMRPLVLEKIWGGRRIARLTGKGAPHGRPIGESWEVADLPEGASTVESGPLEGATLSELRAQYGRELVGARVPEGERFPLLVKILDAADDLSVQVHPSDEHARRVAGARSKDECWLILERDEGARVLHGLVAGAGARDLEDAVARGDAERLLREVVVEPGDVIRVPPGTFHAIGRGLMLLEVQEPSDTTYRVWDYGRRGFDGKVRELHVAEAVAVGNFGEQPPPREAPRQLGEGRELLVDAGPYRMERVEVRRLTASLTSGGPLVVFALGALDVAADDGAPVSLAPCQCVVVPAAARRLELSSPDAAACVLAGLGGAPLVEAR